MSTLSLFDRNSRNLFDDFFYDFPLSFTPTVAGKATPVDISETADAFLISLEAPGFSSKDLEIDYSKGQLTISGNRESEKEDKNQNYHLKERSTKSFRRSFTLRDIQESDIRADFDNGILNIVLPKSEKVKPRKISIGESSNKKRSLESKT